MAVQYHRCLATSCLALLCVLVAASTALATTIIDDGGTTTISIASDDIEVRDSSVPSPTTVNIVAGALLSSNGDRSVALLDNSVLNMTDGETADSVLVTDNAQATISGGVIGDDVVVSGTGRATITGGSIDDDLNVSGYGRAELSTGLVVGDDVNATGNALIIMSADGEIDDDAFFRGSSRLEMNGGEFPDELQFFDSATALFTGGVVGDDVVVANSAQVEIQSLVVDDAIEASVDCLVDIYGGEVGNVLVNGRAEAIEDHSVARINVYGGQHGALSAYSADTDYTDVVVRISGGTFEDGVAVGGPGAVVNITNVTVETSDARELAASNLGELNVDGGVGTDVEASATVGGTVNLNGFTANNLDVISLGGYANVNGGDADALHIMTDRGNATWRGGDFGSATIDAVFSSIVEIYGTDFRVNGVRVGSGDVVDVSGEITGILADGSAFAAQFTRQVDPEDRTATIRLVQVPEPATMLLMAIAVAGACLGRRAGGRRA